LRRSHSVIRSAPAAVRAIITGERWRRRKLDAVDLTGITHAGVLAFPTGHLGVDSADRLSLASIVCAPATGMGKARARRP
jgi:hypothetical protein